MPRSSRHRPHGSRHDIEYSNSEGDADMNEKNGKGVKNRGTMDSRLEEKSKVASQSRHDASEDRASSRRYKVRANMGSPDRGNAGGSEHGDGVILYEEAKGGSLRHHKSDQGSKSRVSVDSKSKPSRRHGGISEEEIVAGNEGSRDDKSGSKRWREKDSIRTVVKRHKESKEEVHWSGNDKEEQRVRRQPETIGGNGRVKRRYRSQSLDCGEAPPVKHSKKAKLPLQDELRNPDLQKELEKQTRRKNGYSDKGKCQDDVRERDEKQVSSRADRSRDGRCRDGLKNANDREKKSEYDRGHRHKDGKQSEDVGRRKRCRDDHASREHSSGKHGLKRMKDENTSKNGHEKLRDDKESRRYDDKKDQGYLRYHSTKERGHVGEKKSSTRRSCPGHAGVDIDTDHKRKSKQTEAQSGHVGSEKRTLPNAASVREVTGASGTPENASVFQSREKSLQIDGDYFDKLSTESSQNPAANVSPIQPVDKWHSSSPDQRRYRKSRFWPGHDTGHSVHRSGCFDESKNHSGTGDQASGVDNASNWLPGVANGFAPYLHGLSPAGFHPMMQQQLFSSPSMTGIRHPMDFIHPMLPYHMPNSENFPFGWLNPMGESNHPLLAWNANNFIMGSDSHIYGRFDSDHRETIMSNQGWETIEQWKQNSQKGDNSMPVPSDQLPQSGQNEPNLNEANLRVDNQPADVAKDTSKAYGDLYEKADHVSNISGNDDACLPNPYLAKLDISPNLTDPDLYKLCISLSGSEQGSAADKDDSQLIHDDEVEAEGRVRALSDWAAASEKPDVFERAMALYKKQKEESRAILRSLSNGRVATSLHADKDKGLVPGSAVHKEQGKAVSSVDVEEQTRGTVFAPLEAKEEMPEPIKLVVIAEKSEPDPANSHLEEMPEPIKLVEIAEKSEPDPANSQLEGDPSDEVKMKLDPDPINLSALLKNVGRKLTVFVIPCLSQLDLD